MKVLAFTGAGISKESGVDTFLEHPHIRDALYRDVAKNDVSRYQQAIKAMKKQIDPAQPNDAHLALAEYDVEILTMNIDGLHEKAGSNPITLHGTMPEEHELEYCHTLYNKPVLYGDMAPSYEVAIQKVLQLQPGDVFLVVGASMSTAISGQLQYLAQAQQAKVIAIQADAATEVRKVLEEIYHVENR